jgi:hypothetical protein
MEESVQLLRGGVAAEGGDAVAPGGRGDAAAGGAGAGRSSDRGRVGG